MLQIARVSSKYQVTIPSEIRNAMNIQVGDRVAFQTLDDGGVLIKPMKKSSSKSLVGALGKMRTQDTSHTTNHLSGKDSREGEAE